MYLNFTGRRHRDFQAVLQWFTMVYSAQKASFESLLFIAMMSARRVYTPFK